MSASKRFVRAACTVAVVLGLLPSCQKAIDYFEKHPDAYVPPCRITNIRISPFGRPSNFIVSYDAQGRPVSMMDSVRYPSSGWDQYFRYDKFNRVSDWMIAYPPSLYAVEWNKYYYARPDYVIDTAMFYETGIVSGPSPIAKYTAEYYIQAFSLDRLGRIVKVWSIPNDTPHTPSLQTTFVYDANGNLVPPDPALSYDNKVNVYRTSKTWQFVYKDYSRNNVEHPAGNFSPQYNIFGLPLNLDNLEGFGIYLFREENYAPQTVVDYACDVPKGPVVY